MLLIFGVVLNRNSVVFEEDGGSVIRRERLPEAFCKGALDSATLDGMHL